MNIYHVSPSGRRRRGWPGRSFIVQIVWYGASWSVCLFSRVNLAGNSWLIDEHGLAVQG